MLYDIVKYKWLVLDECLMSVDVRCLIYDVLLIVNNVGNFKKYYSFGLN